ncbi:aspartate aminotransferase [Candidatus Gottesmanbacteria bacterium RIFCSPLOWO2_01_FULL_49_10]|uniref:Aminotransferase n=1 Tax=Candidatus Gottesmanbacteria bacterium RIFCSPLOWO2_01_FULL_49_10 TaxID=1798396 RepID=A0A1F6AZC5_9BACT|nr:MAG: aspartate aminotransferase [Candidatus Gottesmanbacteria bacterium RIFCSPLOWO2_01_FULL_49_10]
MRIKPFKLERYFAPYEFSAKYLLCSSDCDGLSQKELVRRADEESKTLWDNLKLGYTESQGHPLLRVEVAKLYTNISTEDVLIVAPEEGIFILLNVLLNRGDHVVCTFPGYQSHYEVVESLGCEVTRWTPKESENWKFDIDELAKLVRPNTKLIIINFPHNPTGYLPSREDFGKIIELAKEKNIYLFSDAMYWLLEYDPTFRLPAACDLYDRAIDLFGMSKTFGMAGARIGWLATRDKKLLEQVKIFKDYTTICSSAPSEILSIIALRNKEAIINTHLRRIEKNLRLLDSFFDKFSSKFTWVRPKAGTIGFPRILFEEEASSFCGRVVKETGIMLLPSTVYDYDNYHFRIGFGRENMPEALEKFEDYIKKSL